MREPRPLPRDERASPREPRRSSLRTKWAWLRHDRLKRPYRGAPREAEVELRIAKARDHIARDVHNVLAHSLAVVIAQADGVRLLGSARPQVADDALSTFADSARAALVDVHSLIEALREDPGLELQPRFLDIDIDIDDLIARVAATRMQIGATHHGTAPG